MLVLVFDVEAAVLVAVVAAYRQLQQQQQRQWDLPRSFLPEADASIEPQGRYLAVLMCKNVTW